MWSEQVGPGGGGGGEEEGRVKGGFSIGLGDGGWGR